MAGDTTVGQFCPFSYGKGLPERLRNSSGAVPVYGSNGIVGWHDTPLTQGPTVIVGRKGTVGAVHLSLTACWPIDTTFFVEFADAREARFAYYLLGTLSLEQMNSDSAVPGLNRDAAHARGVRIPDAAHRAAIACILGALDDKIDLNKRMNETLEATARAIFKSWFVDYDPVHVKAAGKQPSGLAPHIADLFPDDLEGSELREIPKGWEIASVSDICEFAYGKSLEASTRNPGEVPVMGSNGQVGWHDVPLVAGPGIVVGRKGNPGVVTWVNGSFYPIDTTFYIVPRLTWVPLSYLYYVLMGLDLPHLSADSAVPGLNRNIAYMSRLLLPSRKILEVFDRHFQLIMNRAYQNEQENRTLTALRDVLLPKLISGELRVPDAGRYIERCMH